MAHDINVAIYQNDNSILGIGKGTTKHEAIQKAIDDAKFNFPFEKFDFDACNMEMEIGGCAAHGHIYYAFITESTYDVINAFGVNHYFEVNGGELALIFMSETNEKVPTMITVTRNYNVSEGVSLEVFIDYHDGNYMDSWIQFTGAGFCVSGCELDEFVGKLGQLIDGYRI